MSEEANTLTSQNEQVWRTVFGEGNPKLNKYRELRKLLPSPPRCTLCLAPFRGLGGFLMKLRGITRNERNGNYCNRCDGFIQAHPGSAEVELTMIFTDVEGSTRLSEELSDDAMYTQLINHRFRIPVIDTIMKNYGFIMDITGDSIFTVYPPGFSGE